MNSSVTALALKGCRANAHQVADFVLKIVQRFFGVGETGSYSIVLCNKNCDISVLSAGSIYACGCPAGTREGTIHPKVTVNHP
jgi:hypothetical protein